MIRELQFNEIEVLEEELMSIMEDIETEKNKDTPNYEFIKNALKDIEKINFRLKRY
jgi:hypothetical protein